MSDIVSMLLAASTKELAVNVIHFILQHQEQPAICPLTVQKHWARSVIMDSQLQILLSHLQAL